MKWRNAAFGGVLARLRNLAPRGQAWPKRALSARLQALVAIVEGGLAIGIAILIGNLFWTLFSPLPEPTLLAAPAAPAARTGAVQNPFRPTAPEFAAPAAPDAAIAAAVETALDLKLFGTWAEGDGKGSAVIQIVSEGPAQRVFKVGDDICCGARLEAVYADQVIISRAGAREALRLPHKSSASGPAPNAGAPLIPAETFAGAVTLTSLAGDDGKFVLRAFPAGDPARFEALGLRPGDILVEIDGKPAPTDLASAAQLISSFAAIGIVTVTVDRDGVRFPADIPIEEFLGDIGVN